MTLSTALYIALKGFDVYATAMTALLIVSVAGDNLAHILASLGFGILTMIALGSSIQGAALSTALAFLCFVSLYSFRRSDTLRVSIASLAIFTPLYIAYPQTIITATVFGLTLLFAVFREYLRLGKAEITVSEARRFVRLGEALQLSVRIRLSGEYRYRIVEDGVKLAEGIAVGETVIPLLIPAKHLGVQRSIISIVLEDVRGLAKVIHGPYTVSYVVTANFLALLRRAEEAIQRFINYVSLPRVLTLAIGSRGSEAGAGRAGEMGIGGEAEASTGLGGPGPGAGAYETTKGFEEPLRLVIAAKLLREIKAYLSRVTAKVPFGEYIGVREFTPGDSLRAIHWKKSFRRELLEDLYVKLFASASGEAGGGKGAKIILADLIATNPRELDTLLTALYAEILRDVERGEIFKEIHLLIRLPNEDIHYISGKAVDVLLAINAIVLRGYVKPLYSYYTWRRSRGIVLGEAKGFIAELENYYKLVAMAIADTIKKFVGRATIILIHSNALAYKYAIVSHVLREAGFIVTPRHTS